MARNKIGFITGVGGNPTGIGSYVQQLDSAGIPAVIMANDTTTGISDALNADGDHVMVFRVVRDGSETYSVPRYNLSPYDAALSHWNIISQYFPQEVVDNKDKVWIQPVNEVDKTKADWLGKFGVEIAKIANSRGYKVILFAWASGEPEPMHWREQGMVEYLQYCANNHDSAGIALHEYDYGMVGMSETYPYHAGRFQFLFDACDELGITKPQVFITEWGWSYTNIPPVETCLEDIDWAARLYAQHEEIKGAGIWYLGPGYSNIANKVNALISRVTQYTLENVLPDPVPDTGEPNYLLNPSFEYGWYHPDNVPELQIPNDWLFAYADETEPNPYDSNPWSIFRRPEVRTLPKSSLPDHEQDLFVLDGEYCVKIFKGSGSLYYSMSQYLTGGKWKLTARVYPDLVSGYNPDGTKIFADDPNSCIIWINIDDETISPEYRPTPGEYNDIELEFECEAGALMQVFFMKPFALVNNCVFLDAWRLDKMDEGCVAREPYNREYWVVPASATREQFMEIAGQAYDDGRRTIGGSYDDAGIGCGLTSKTAVLFGIDEDLKQVFLDWYEENYPGTQVEFRPFGDTTPQ